MKFDIAIVTLLTMKGHTDNLLQHIERLCGVILDDKCISQLWIYLSAIRPPHKHILFENFHSKFLFYEMTRVSFLLSITLILFE